MATIKQVSDGGPDGTTLGQSAADLISFYGTTPVSQRSSSIQTQTHATLASSASFTAGQASSYNSIVTSLNEVIATLTALGVWKGS
jgi:hypothetical protein